MRLLISIVLSLTSLTTLIAGNLPDSYQPGDVVNFQIESKDKVVGSQKTVCIGWQVAENESLYTFQMNTKSIYSQGGKTFDISTIANAGYMVNSLPRFYNFEMDVLNVHVKHDGVFTGIEYHGRTIKFGAEQPFNIATPVWPALFDNNFAFQWEIAMRTLSLEPGQSDTLLVMIPQINQLVELAVTAVKPDVILFDGQRVPVTVYKVDPANQLFYIDGDGRLLKAHDTVRRMSVVRLPEGREVEIKSAGWLSTTMKRLPGYGILLGCALVWFMILGYRHWKRLDVFLLFLISAVLYWPALKLLGPVQNAFLEFAFDPTSPWFGIYVVLFGSALIFALVEELTKFIPIFVRLKITAKIDLRLAIALGAACGAGFSFVQGIHLTAFTANGSIADTADLVQRLFAIGVNTGCGALIGLILASTRPAGFLLIPVGIKTLLNYLVVFVQKGVIGKDFYGIGTFLILVAILAVVYFFYKHSLSIGTKKKSQKKK